MRRKQLYALAMAGILAVSAVPANTYATAFDHSVRVQTGSSQGAEKEAEPSVTPTATPTASKENNNLTVNGQTYKTWESAVNAIVDKGEILVNSDATVEKTVVIPAGKEITVKAAKNVTIKRAEDFTGDMFKVAKATKVEDKTVPAGKLVIGEKNTDSSGKAKTIYSVTLDGTLSEAKNNDNTSKKETGTLVNVEEEASLTINEKTVLKNNKATKNGGAVLNAGTTVIEGATMEGNSAQKGGGVYNTGNLTLKNTTIQKNASDFGGGIYTETNISVAGLMKVSDNTKESNTKAPNNIYLNKNAVLQPLSIKDGESFKIDPIDKNSKISVFSATEISDVSVATPELTEACAILYDSAFWKVNEKGTLEKQLIPVSLLTREKDKIVMTYDFPCDATYYVKWTKQGEAEPDFDLTEKGISAKKGENEITLENVDSNAFTAYVMAKDAFGYTSHKSKITIPAYEGEGTLSEGKIEECTFTVSSTSVTKGTSIEVKTKGDGIGNTNPKKGSTRWVPYSWTLTSSTGTDEVASGYIVKDENGNSVEDKNYQVYEDKTYTTKISTDDLSIKSYKVKATFLEQEYDGEKWIATGNEQSKTPKTVSVKKAPTTKPTSKKPTATSKASTKSAKNAKTGDESPILPMSMLAMGALLAGGYVLVRRRKASDDLDR